jgi:hypothetical protein
VDVVLLGEVLGCEDVVVAECVLVEASGCAELPPE